MGRILIADDHDSLRRGLAQSVAEAGHDVEEAPNGNAAIEKLHEGFFDVVVSDLKMGGSTGLEVLKTAKTLHPSSAIILMTAFGSVSTAVEAMKSGHRAAFFSLEYTERDVLDRLRAIGADPAQFADTFEVDCSDAISADYVVKQMAAAPRGTVVVIDYLQLLDQRRENPDLTVQVRALKSFARDKGLIVVFISQIDRSYDPSTKPCPDLSDVRLPNPLDLKLFDKTCFLNNAEVQFRAAS